MGFISFLEQESIQEAELPLFTSEMKNGYVFVIHNYLFPERQDPVRYGSEKDIEALKRLFEVQLGFTMKVKENLKAKEMLEKMRDISERDFSKNDSLFIVIMSHGKKTGILGVNEETIHPAVITDFFTADKCPTLMGKPKVFILQACRGDKDDFGAVAPDAGPMSARVEAVQVMPLESDFLVCYACPVGFSSYRDEEEGSWYIQQLVKIFLKYADKDHLMDLMLRVNFTVSRKLCEAGYKQIPSEECRLTKKYYFIKPNNA